MSENRQTGWDVEPASPAKISQTHTGVRHVKPTEAISEKINALVNILIICFDMCITHAAVLWRMYTHASTHAQEGGEAQSVVANGEVVWFGPDNLHYVLIELGLFPLSGESKSTLSFKILG